MKISVIIITILITQVSASFFDVFQGAVLSVQNSFGKLISDVVTDVRDTVDCTILAVEHVLSLSDEATAQYYEKCGNGNQTDSAGGAQQDGSLPKAEVSLEFSNKDEFLQKEIDAKINDTLSKVLDNYNPHDNLLSVENVLAKESKQLADVNKLVKQELNKLSNEVHTDLKNIKQKDSEPSVDTILQEIKLLENKEQNTKNTSVATEIHQVIDEVLAKLDIIEVTEANENIKLDEILRNLEKNSNNSFIGLRQQFEEWKEEESRHLADIKSKIEEHEKNVELHDYIYKSHGSNYTHPVQINMEMQKNTEPPEIKGPTKDPLRNETVLQESIINAVSEPSQLSAQLNGMLYSIPKTVETSNEVSSTTLKYEPTNIALTMIDQTVNYNTATSTTFSSKKNTFLSTQENTTTTENVTFSTNKPTTIQKQVSDDVSNDTLTGTRFPIVDKGTIQPDETTTDSEDQESSLVTSAPTNLLLENNYFNDTVRSNSSFREDSVFESVTIVPVEYETTPGGEFSMETTNEVTSVSTIAPDSNSNDTMISKTLSSTISSTSVSEAIQTVENISVSAYEESSSDAINNFTTSAVTKDNNLATYTPPTLIASTPVTKIIKLAKTTTFSTTEPPLTTSIPSTSISDTIQTVETIAVSGNEKSSTVAINNVTTSAVIKDNDFNDNIATNTSLMLIVSTPVTGIIQVAETSAASTIEEVVTTSVPTLDAEIINDSSVTVNFIGNTSTENEESSTMTTHRMAAIDPNDSLITGTPFATSETTYISDINLLVKSTTPIAKGETVTLIRTQSVDITKKIINDNNDQNDAVTTTEGTTLANVNNQTGKIDTDLERQELTSSSTSTTSTVFSITEKTPIIRDTTSPTTTTIKSSEYRDLYTLTTNSFLPTPKIYKIHDVNHVVTNRPTFAITEGPFVEKNIPFFHRSINPINREWLPPMQHEMAPYKLNQQIYPNANGVPKNNYASDIPQSLRDRDSHLYPTITRGKSMIPARNLYQNPYFANPVSPNHNDPRITIDSIRKSTGTLGINMDPYKDVSTLLLNNDSNMLPPDRYSPNIYNQEPNTKTDTEKQKAATDYKNHINKLMNSYSPPDIATHRKFETLPASSTVTKEEAQRRPERMNYLNPPYVQIPQNRIRPPYPLDERAPNTYRSPRVLTTYRPMTTVTRRVNNYDNPPFDYDSFFHNSRNKNSEAHQRALKEARELIENSKRSHEIIDKILKNKNYNGARSIFNNPGTLNSGK